MVAQKAMLPIRPTMYVTANSPPEIELAVFMTCPTEEPASPASFTDQMQSAIIRTIRTGPPMFWTHLMFSIPLYATHAMKIRKMM